MASGASHCKLAGSPEAEGPGQLILPVENKAVAPFRGDGEDRKWHQTQVTLSSGEKVWAGYVEVISEKG